MKNCEFMAISNVDFHVNLCTLGIHIRILNELVQLLDMTRDKVCIVL